MAETPLKHIKDRYLLHQMGVKSEAKVLFNLDVKIHTSLTGFIKWTRNWIKDHPQDIITHKDRVIKK